MHCNNQNLNHIKFQFFLFLSSFFSFFDAGHFFTKIGIQSISSNSGNFNLPSKPEKNKLVLTFIDIFSRFSSKTLFENSIFSTSQSYSFQDEIFISYDNSSLNNLKTQQDVVFISFPFNFSYESSLIPNQLDSGFMLTSLFFLNNSNQHIVYARFGEMYIRYSSNSIQSVVDIIDTDQLKIVAYAKSSLLSHFPPLPFSKKQALFNIFSFSSLEDQFNQIPDDSIYQIAINVLSLINNSILFDKFSKSSEFANFLFSRPSPEALLSLPFSRQLNEILSHQIDSEKVIQSLKETLSFSNIKFLLQSLLDTHLNPNYIVSILEGIFSHIYEGCISSLTTLISNHSEDTSIWKSLFKFPLFIKAAYLTSNRSFFQYYLHHHHICLVKFSMI